MEKDRSGTTKVQFGLNRSSVVRKVRSTVIRRIEAKPTFKSLNGFWQFSGPGMPAQAFHKSF
jgi:hypothetical protein